MDDIANQVIDGFETGAGILWKALWALIFGYVISSSIQVLITRSQMAKTLGERSPRAAGIAGFFGFVSSSCSFAALAATRSIFVKGAHSTNATAFLIASTNLVIELGIVLWLLLGWQFFLANILLGLLMIVITYGLGALWFPRAIADTAREHAEKRQQSEMDHDPGDLEGLGFFEKLTSARGLQAIADAFFMEWRMVYREILFGFTMAGFITVFVPDSFWNALFLFEEGSSPSPLVVVQNALIAPIIAFFTFIGSMGNVPLAALLWSKNASFGGVMAFLGADLVAATVIWVRFKYYGLQYTLYLSALLYVAMVSAGIMVHYLFDLTGMIPSERPSLQDQVHFAIDYTFFLNLVFGALGLVLVWLHLKRPSEQSASTTQQQPQTR